MAERLRLIELAQGHQGAALIELSAEMQVVAEDLTEHARRLEKIERKQRAESDALDDHEKRLKAVEPAP